MTRRRDMMLEDLFGCSHEPTLPISQGGTILYWRCTCGKRRVNTDEQQAKVDLSLRLREGEKK